MYARCSFFVDNDSLPLDNALLLFVTIWQKLNSCSFHIQPKCLARVYIFLRQNIYSGSNCLKGRYLRNYSAQPPLFFPVSVTVRLQQSLLTYQPWELSASLGMGDTFNTEFSGETRKRRTKKHRQGGGAGRKVEAYVLR